MDTVLALLSIWSCKMCVRTISEAEWIGFEIERINEIKRTERKIGVDD